MKQTDWKKVNEILEDVLAINPTERKDYFEENKFDKEIVKEVESLLAFEDEAESALNLSAVEFSKDFVSDEEENPLIGQQIGAYKIERELGQGGMGAVYLATRTDGKFSQRVALKLLKREMNTTALRRRFQMEREILASLEHPNIARLLNAGTTEDKIPYIAMEYVEGLPIDIYCNKHNLDLDQRLNLFRKVCSAVDFAHRNLIVHRDLKPSNILVTTDGTPKLLDFGISKILSENFSQINKATVTKMGVMTPSYASPEQLNSKSVTTATDIYSLGVILYEILSGHRPFEDKEDDIKGIYSAVIENEPPLPSAIINTFSKKIKKISEAKTEIKEYEKSETRNAKDNTDSNRSFITKPNTNNIKSNLLKGDLDNIILKALKKEPERRYSSAENFAEDIKRHQDGNPVTARPDTFSYRAGKFIKRNILAVGAVSLILLAIVGGIIATLWQARVAQTERVKAERRFNDVRKLANSFLFEFSPKIENLPGSTPARELLVKRALEYLDNLSKESSYDAELQRELAMAYEKVGDVQGNPENPNIGDTKGAAVSYNKSLIIRQKLLKEEPNSLTAMSDMAVIYARISNIQPQINTIEEQKTYHQKSLELREKIVEQNPIDFEARKNLAIAVGKTGTILFRDGKYKESIEHFEKAKDIYERLKDKEPDNPQITRSFGYMFVDIGEAQGWNGDAEISDTSLKKGLDILIPLSEKYPNDQIIQQSLVEAFRRKAASSLELGDVKKTELEYRKALAIGEKLLKADPQNTKAKRDMVATLRNLGAVTKSLDVFNSATEIMKEVRMVDTKNPQIIYEASLISYQTAEIYESNKDYDSALRLFNESKIDFQKAIDLDPKFVFAVRLNNMCFRDIGRINSILAEKTNKKELLQNSLTNFRSAVDGFKKMKSMGNLGEYDDKEISNIEDEIVKIENKLKK